MENGNQTIVKFFILKGISDIPKLQTPIFILILLIYLITLGGNLTILFLVIRDSKLHTPMYFFLGNLSIIDISSTSVSLHKVLSTYVTGDNTISFHACMAQAYLFLSFTGDEMCILAAMSYDRYVAICNPLHYPMVMNSRVCILLATICWVCSFIDIIPYVSLLSSYSCHISNIINHFYCDIVPIMKLSCSDLSALKLLIYTEGLVFGFTPWFLTFLSYVFIIITILRITSSTGRLKAFYTCSSHLTVVILLYVTLFCLYMRPNAQDNLESTKLFSLFNTVAVPLINPIIYTLKNKDVTLAMKRQLRYFKGNQ
ncbi:olfactory receptor 1019-like [Bombina bombina]|uniref:olfactory receptor 1019-like n=1 Tax=Bombina bombina TaxID=8345 RepID=UPI00235A9958|nr:olfactory receptor 1019-like [Bombina bombina]